MKNEKQRVTYKKTDEMISKISTLAGRYFKEYGYEKTTFRMISKKLNISNASISYHFKSKSWLLFYLFAKGMDEISAYVLSHTDESFNAYKAYCATHIYFYRKIMTDERNCALFYHPENRALWVNEQLHVVEGYFRAIMTDFKKEFTEDDLRTVSVMSLGAKLSLFKEFTKRPGVSSVDAHCRSTAALVGMLARLDEAAIERNVRGAFAFADNHTLPPMDFLG